VKKYKPCLRGFNIIVRVQNLFFDLIETGLNRNTGRVNRS
jgi:hypothetical protein